MLRARAPRVNVPPPGGMRELGIILVGGAALFVALCFSMYATPLLPEPGATKPAQVRDRALSRPSAGNVAHGTSGVPDLMYGTAWKKERTRELVSAAIRSGFRAIDTAAQPKHYNQRGVGDGIRDAGLPREALYLQTKFTPLSGQDPARLPYDARAPLERQVQQSVEKSLEELGTRYLDAVLLHSPLPTFEETLRAWRVLEDYVDRGVIRRLGVSNVDVGILSRLHRESRVKPSCAQNRFRREGGFDGPVRAFCRAHGLQHQTFWTLTANKAALQGRTFRAIAAEKGLTTEQLMYTYVMQLGGTPLSGTTSPAHMAEDVALSRAPEKPRWLVPAGDPQNGGRAGWDIAGGLQATPMRISDGEMLLLEQALHGREGGGSA